MSKLTDKRQTLPFSLAEIAGMVGKTEADVLAMEADDAPDTASRQRLAILYDALADAALTDEPVVGALGRHLGNVPHADIHRLADAVNDRLGIGPWGERTNGESR